MKQCQRYSATTVFISVECNACATCLMYRYQQEGKSLQKFNFEFSKCIQVVSNCKPKDVTYSLKIYVYVHKLFILANITKTIRHVHPTLQRQLIMDRKLKENSVATIFAHLPHLGKISVKHHKQLAILSAIMTCIYSSYHIIQCFA